MGVTGVELLADALPYTRENERGTQVGVVGAVRGPPFDPPSPLRDAQHIGAVVVAVAGEDRRPSEAGHAALLHESLVAVDRRRDHGTDGGGMAQHSGDELVAEIGQSAGAWIIGGGKQI